ncbi:MAG: hypothetical protein Q9162_000866 [Coniocarpon cinnabarinum]
MTTVTALSVADVDAPSTPEDVVNAGPDSLSETPTPSTVWRELSDFDVDLTPPIQAADPPPSPRARQASVFDSFARLPGGLPSPASKLLGKRPASDSSLGMGNPALKRPLVSRPTCTHISMVKIYFDPVNNPIRCNQCGRVPSLGFLYLCEQDEVHPPQRPAFQTGSYPNNGISGKKPRKLSKDKRQSSLASGPLDMSCLSLSLRNGIKNNHYTPQQIDLLIQQKEHMISTITQAQIDAGDERRSKNDSPSKNSEKLATLDEDGKKSVLPSVLCQKARRISVSKFLALCDYKVCHSCRPNSREKTFMSFGSVLNGEMSPLVNWCPRTMPIASVSVVRKLGLREVPQHLTTSNFSVDNGFEPMMAGALNGLRDSPRPTTWSPPMQPRASASTEGFRHGLRRSLLDLLRMRLGAPSPASAPPSVDTSTASTLRDSAYNTTESTPVTEKDSESSDMATPVVEQSTAQKGQSNVLSDACTTKEGKFDADLWRKMSNEVLARAAKLQLSEEPYAESSSSATQYRDMIGTGDLGTMKQAKMVMEQNILEEKLRALKDSVEDQDGEAGLDLGTKFEGLGLRLTEEAAETNSPDVIVKTE